MACEIRDISNKGLDMILEESIILRPFTYLTKSHWEYLPDCGEDKENKQEMVFHDPDLER